MSQPRVESFSFTPSARVGATLSEMKLHAAWRRPLRQQIIVPFLLLLVFVAVVGVAALTYQATSAGMAGFDQSLVRASVQANDRLATLEAGRLNDLRALGATPELTAAVAAGDRLRLSALFAADPYDRARSAARACRRPLGRGCRLCDRRGGARVALQQQPADLRPVTQSVVTGIQSWHWNAPVSWSIVRSVG